MFRGWNTIENICFMQDGECDMEYLTAGEMAEKWNISSKRVLLLCNQGRVEGAVKKD